MDGELKVENQFNISILINGRTYSFIAVGSSQEEAFKNLKADLMTIITRINIDKRDGNG